MDLSRMITIPRAALLSLSLLALACGGGGGKPPIQDLPQAFLTVPQSNVAGDKLTVMISATGCDQIHSLSIYDNEDFLKSVAYAGGGTVSVDLGSNEIKYTRGIAAQMSLKARVVCTDGRQNDSQPQPATFFPVAEVIEAPSNGLQVVPDYFVAEGSEPLVNFVGCGNLPTGLGRLFRVNKNGQVLAWTDMHIPCTAATVITPPHPTTRKRWVWTPDFGAMSIDEQMNPATQARIDVAIDLLTVGPDGDAVVYDAGGGGSAKGVYRYSHTGNNTLKWAYAPRGFVLTNPVFRSDGAVTIASVTGSSDRPGFDSAIVIATVDYGNQNPATGGIETDAFVLSAVNVGDDFSRTPSTIFNADGSVLYVGFQGLNQLSEVHACTTQPNGCDTTTRRWKSTTLQGAILAQVPFANGARLAAVSGQKVWILDTSTGAIVNKNQEPLTSRGALVILQVQPGGGAFPHAFYLLTGPLAQQGLPPPMPLEIVATDSADRGELYRYQINNGSMSVAVDGSGTLWMRVNKNLVRPLSPAQYRQIKP
jgi:hypothetical protein